MSLAYQATKLVKTLAYGALYNYCCQIGFDVYGVRDILVDQLVDHG